MDEISPTVKKLVAQIDSTKGILEVIDGLLNVNSELTNDLINLQARCRINEKMYRNKEVALDAFLVELSNCRISLLFYIDKLVTSIVTTAGLGKINILYVASSPLTAEHIQVDFEYKQIKKEILASPNREIYQLSDPLLAASIKDLGQQLSILQPAIIHFAGHSGQRGFLLSDENNSKQIVTPTVLSSVIKRTAIPQCAFFNACYSAEHAAEIGQYIPLIIGMNNEIIDETAVIFSQAFYGMLTATNPPGFEQAFHLSKAVLSVEKPDQDHIPELWVRGQKVSN